VTVIGSLFVRKMVKVAERDFGDCNSRAELTEIVVNRSSDTRLFSCPDKWDRILEHFSHHYKIHSFAAAEIKTFQRVACHVQINGSTVSSN
jgi:hypothetical protein